MHLLFLLEMVVLQKKKINKKSRRTATELQNGQKKRSCSLFKILDITKQSIATKKIINNVLHIQNHDKIDKLSAIPSDKKINKQKTDYIPNVELFNPIVSKPQDYFKTIWQGITSTKKLNQVRR